MYAWGVTATTRFGSSARIASRTRRARRWSSACEKTFSSLDAAFAMARYGRGPPPQPTAAISVSVNEANAGVFIGYPPRVSLARCGRGCQAAPRARPDSRSKGWRGPLLRLLRQAVPDVVGADDPGDVLHHHPRARDIGARVQHHHHRHPFGRQVVGVDHVAHDVAVVADPAVLVFERQPVERAVAFRGRRQELLLLLLHGGRDQLADDEVAGPLAHVVERR